MSAGADQARREQGSGRREVVVGVTGGIGSGKSTVGRLFQERGADLVDTDEIAHELTRPNQPALQEIAARLGGVYLSADGRLDRVALRARVFSDSAARRDLEAILHPMIRRSVEARVWASPGPYVLILVPLLVETGGYRDLIDRVLVVDCDEQLQVRRAMQRSGLSEDQVRAVMQAQASRATRLALADDVLDNGGSLAHLASQVETLDTRYRIASISTSWPGARTS